MRYAETLGEFLQQPFSAMLQVALACTVQSTKLPGKYCVAVSGLTTQPNCCNINLYRHFFAFDLCSGFTSHNPDRACPAAAGDGRDSVGWHTDDEERALQTADSVRRQEGHRPLERDH